MQFQSWEDGGALEGAPMPFSREALLQEAERLVARAAKRFERFSATHADPAMTERAERELQRLQLYQAILSTTEAAHAIMPEYARARGLLGSVGADAETKASEPRSGNNS
jgi:hypothetical protein